MLKKTAMALILVLVVILGLALTQPDSFKVQRSATIKAPPAKVMAYLNDFHQWPAWSPWEKLDPNLQRTFGGAASGKGATYAWNGNDKVGQGRMEILESAPTQLDIKLDFIKPFASSNRTEFVLQPQGDATVVTWTMTGPSQFITKLMGVFFSMDKMVGKDFEKGLAQLKAAAEK
ncbi:polyketide cyclase [Pseudoduganella eburnea]|uniref:Polyketide cyclase n=1 Tax=Massilia eburnea TaxID=1776165 RepID=A0A6L6QGU1_9BURK|nr:SRPBCC family protein [Massilia eburnea]MTW11294.1 polyketide cyclase [Massilia eburnea]